MNGYDEDYEAFLREGYDEDYSDFLRREAEGVALRREWIMEIEEYEDDMRHDMMEFYADMQGEPLMRRYGKC